MNYGTLKENSYRVYSVQWLKIRQGRQVETGISDVRKRKFIFLLLVPLINFDRERKGR